MITQLQFRSPLIDKSGNPTREFTEWLTLVRLASDSVTQSGTTTNRPTANLWVGRFYYDTTLNLPIFVKEVTPAVVWIDAAGNTV